MAYPTPETVQNHGVKTPDDFDRESFRVAVVEAHTFAGAQLLEMACFLEPHASGEGVRMGELLALEAEVSKMFTRLTKIHNVYGPNRGKCSK